MERQLTQLTMAGYEVVCFFGDYCRACRQGRDVILRWNGHCWVEM